jgi:hypothetical protein
VSGSRSEIDSKNANEDILMLFYDNDKYLYYRDERIADVDVEVEAADAVELAAAGALLRRANGRPNHAHMKLSIARSG